MKQTTLILIGIGIAQLLNGQTDFKTLVSRQKQLARQAASDVEGFNKKTSGQDIAYHSAMGTVSPALLVRSTNGKMNAVWESAPFTAENIKGDSVSFFFSAGMSLKGYELKEPQPGFTLFINGQKFFSWENRMGPQWNIKSDKGGVMHFTGIHIDNAGDAFGFVRITLPSNLIGAGSPAHFELVGHASGSQHWFMVFQNPHALGEFLKKASTDDWLTLTVKDRGQSTTLSITTPLADPNLEIQLKGPGFRQSVKMHKALDNKGFAEFDLKSDITKLTSENWYLSVGSKEFWNNKPFVKDGQFSEIGSDFVQFVETRKMDQNGWIIELENHASSITSDLQRISKSPLSDGVFHIISSSHQDIAWMDSPEECMIDRDELLITPAIRQILDNPLYYNDMEDILMLREYLERHPDQKPIIHQLGLAGKLFWGASYIQPYEEMYLGESLIRQFYLGRKWYKREFPGCDTKIYWNVDVPGRTLQMPQILKKSGVDYMMISRHEKGLFYWSAPDGSRVLTFSPDHYYNDYVKLKQGFFQTVGHLADLTGQWERVYKGASGKPVMPVLADADMALPDMYFHYIDDWNALRKGTREGNSGLTLPELKHSTALAFMQEAEQSGANFKTIQGERPAVWLYIHGPSHFEALKYGRSAGRTLPAAEKMATIRGILAKDWSKYPTDRLERAWEKAIYPDHGWGGNQGTITDSTFLAKFYQADTAARAIIKECGLDIAGEILHQSSGIPVTVFNTLSWERTDPVEIEIQLDDRQCRNFEIRSSEGNPILFQTLEVPQQYKSGYLKTVKVLFVASRIPSMGYSTFYVRPSKGVLVFQSPKKSLGTVISTPHYDIVPGIGGLKSVYDKELGKQIWETDQFITGELFSLQSIGNGAGEFADIQQPDTTGFERTKDLMTGWEVKEDGPIRMVIEANTEMRHNKARLTWIIYKTLKRLDVKVDLIDWDGTAYREFRLAFPANLVDPKLSYEVPFGVVQVGKDEIPGAAGERYITPCTEVHPRGINNWFSASDENFGVTISSSVAVWDYVNMTHLPTKSALLQPILMASRQSCHGLGPLYHQTGSHSMEFSIFSHLPGWENGYKSALQANEPLIAVINREGTGKSLPAVHSFISVSDPGAIISTFKKEEYGDSMIIRIFNMEGKDKDININPSFEFTGVYRSNLLEEPEIKISEGTRPIRLTLGHHSIETLLLKR